MRGRRWIQILSVFAVMTSGMLWQTTCNIRLPGTLFVADGNDHDDGCDGFCVGDFDDGDDD